MRPLLFNDCSMSELLIAENLEPLLEGSIFAGKVRHFDFIDSTNTAAMHAAANGEAEGAVFIAERQLAGRGRGGHSWHSEPNAGIYLSAILRPQMPASDSLWLSLVTGLAVHDAIARTIGIEADLRWPNDIMLGPKKLGGILTEMSADSERVKHVVIGVGMNVNHASFPAELEALATSLRIETGRDWPRVELAGALLQSLSREYVEFQRGRERGAKDAVIRKFEQRSSYARGARVHVEEDGGYTGTTAGLDPRGFLQVQTESGLRTVISGGVRKLQPR